MSLAQDVKTLIDDAFENRIVAGIKVSEQVIVAWLDGGAYDATTGAVGGGTERSVTTTAVVKKARGVDHIFGRARVEGTEIYLMVRAAAFESTGRPPKGARVLFRSTGYGLLDVADELSLDGAPLLYVLRCGTGGIAR